MRVIRQDGFSFSDLAFSPDASTIAATTLPDLHIWAVGTGEHIPFPKAFVDHVSYSADGRTLVGLAGFGSIGVFDLAARRKVESFTTGVYHHGDVVLSPDGRTLLASSGEGVLHEWDLKTRQDRFAMPDAHGEPVKTVLVTPDGKTVITGSADKTVRLWDLATGKLSRVLPLSGRVEASALSPDGRWLAAATFMFHQVFVWDLQSRSGPVVLAAVQSGHAVSPLALRFVDGNTILLIDQAGNLHELDVKERRHRAGARLEFQLPTRSSPGRATSGSIAPCSSRMGRGSRPTGSPAASTSPTSPRERTVAHWRAGTSSCPRRMDGPWPYRVESGGKFKRWDRMAGRRTGLEMESSGGTIRLLDTGTGKELCWIKVEGSKVWGLAFSPDGKTLAATTGWESGRIHLYDVASGKETRTIDAPATALAGAGVHARRHAPGDRDGRRVDPRLGLAARSVGPGRTGLRASLLPRAAGTEARPAGVDPDRAGGITTLAGQRLLMSGTSIPSAVARSIWCSCSWIRIWRICSASANSPSDSHWRTRSR